VSIIIIINSSSLQAFYVYHWLTLMSCILVLLMFLKTDLCNNCGQWLQFFFWPVKNTIKMYISSWKVLEFFLFRLLWDPEIKFVNCQQSKLITKWLVIISITRYRDIDRGFVKRTISWRPYIVRYRPCTNARLARALLTYCSVCIWLMSLAVHIVRGSLCLTFPAVDLSCSALGAWGGDWGTAVAPVVG